MAERPPKERPPLWRRLWLIADSAVGDLADQWHAWFRGLQRRLRQTDFTEVLAAPNILAAHQLINQAVQATLETPVRREVPRVATQIIEDAGQATTQTVRPTVPAPPYVTGLPETELWIAQHVGTQIRAITETTMRTVRQTLQDGWREGLHPRVLARQLRGMTGLTPRQAGTIEKQAAKWEAEGMRAGPLQKAVRQLQERALRQRAETIARTETLAYSNYGAHSAIQQYVRRGVIDEASLIRQWLFTTDSKCCFCAGTFVETPQGPRLIEQLRPGEVVLTHEGQRQLLATMVRPFAGTLVCVETTGDGFVIMTEDHPVLVGGEWCEAATLRPGDVLHAIHQDVVHVRTVLHLRLQNMQDGPSVLGEEAVSSCFFGRVGMPIDAINFNRNLEIGQGKVQAIPPDGIFLDEGNLHSGQGFAHQAFWRGLSGEASVASARTEATKGYHARHDAPCFSARLTGDMMGGTTAGFGAIAAFIGNVGGFDKLGPASSTVSIDSLGCFAGLRTDDIPMSNRAGNGELFFTDGARFLNERTGSGGIVAGSGTKKALLTGRPMKRDAAVLALRIMWTDAVQVKTLPRTIRSFAFHALSATEVLTTIGTLIRKRHHAILRKVLDEYSLNYSIPVYDLTVEKAHAFYAGGFLVHNCDDCASIPGMNPNGVGLNEEFQTPFGPYLLPPVHPNCRCTVSTISRGTN